MSKVYEALKKAQREGRWREDAGQPAAADNAQLQPVDTISPPPSETAIEPPDETVNAAPQAGSNPEPAAPVESLTESENKQAEAVSTNGAGVNGPVTAGIPEHSEAPFSTELSRGRRFWRHAPPAQTRGPRLILNQESLLRAAEQFQVLRANLDSWAAERSHRVVLITSALPGEGKSFVAVNLAVALSRAGSNVLLIDADLRTPSLHVPFNLVALGGLLPYLEGKAEFAASITATREPRLRLIAAGGVTLSGPEILAGSRMRSLIECARQLQPPHIVLIDAPAAGAGAEAQILSKLVDGTLLVIAANRTPRAAVTRTLELIKGVPLLSAVLNRFEFSYSNSRHLHQ
jgi:protein-tyrosine kinase